VSFSIQPRPGVSLGTRITNTASIVFDTNPAMQTNEVWNTLGVIEYKIYLPLMRRNR
jgi:hypothetical protein